MEAWIQLRLSYAAAEIDGAKAVRDFGARRLLLVSGTCANHPPRTPRGRVANLSHSRFGLSPRHYVTGTKSWLAAGTP